MSRGVQTLNNGVFGRNCTLVGDMRFTDLRGSPAIVVYGEGGLCLVLDKSPVWPSLLSVCASDAA